MQKCAFCEFDYGEITLQEGRCPQCGSIVAWPDEPDSSQPGDTTATIVFPLTQPKAVDANATVIFGGETHQPAATVSPNAAIPAIASSTLPRSAASEDLDKLWRDSISSTSDLRFTIKGVESQHTVSDSLFSVLPREVRSPLNITDAPVDYELLDIIGQGGVGVVYTARQASIDRTVAIKMLREEYRTRNEHKEKFLAEAILTGELDHPNIVPIYDLGRNKNGELFYSMKNVIGTPWDRAIEQKSIRENIEILLKVADAVAFAHSRSVVHRDLKPENVMLGNFGEVLVMDWGIAVATEGFRRTASILRSQAMGGTPAYMAPELATGPVDAIGQPADIYLLGAILFEILTGTPPHYGNNVMECVRNASQNIIRETTVTGELMEIAIRAMATVPRRRFRSVQAFQAAIRLYQAHSESIMLSDNAETELNKAISTKDYSGFSRAVFAFDEALSLWNENEAATLGLMRAKTAYAKTAFEKGDYDLGLSLLNPEDSEHQGLVKKLRAAIADREARQNRFRTIRKLAVSLAGFIIIAGTIALIVILQLYSRASHLNAELDLSQEDLRSELKKTEKAVMTVSSDGTAGWWDFKTGTESPRERLRHLSSVQLASMSPSGRYLVSSTSIDQRKTQLWLWDLMTGEKVRTKELSSELVQDMVFSSTSTPSVYVTTSGIDDSRKRIWQWNGMQESWKEVGKSGMLSESLWGAIPTDGDSNLVTYGGRGARLWRMQDGVELKSFRPSASIGAIAFAANGRLLASASDDGTAMIWDVQKRSSTQKLVGSHSGAIRDLAFSMDDTKLITSGADGRIVVWDATLGNPIQSGRISETAVVGNSIRFSPDGETILVGCDDDSIRLYDANTLAQTRNLPGHTAAVTCASFSQDGRWIVSGSQDKTIRVWSVSTGKEIARLLGHSAPLTWVSFSSDGLRVLSSSQDTTARLWDVDRIAQSAENSSEPTAEESGADLGEVLLLEFHSRETTVAEFSPDGRSILTASVDGKAVLWPSERVPLSLRMSNPNITYQPNDGPKRIDPLAVLCQPGSLDLDGAKLDVNFAKDEGNSKRLLIDQSDGMFEIQGSKLHYHPTKNTRIEIGSYEEWVGVGMQITFSKSATHAGAQQLVRHIAYQSESQKQAGSDVKSKVIIQVMNPHGLSGNAVPESIIISHLESDR